MNDELLRYTRTSRDIRVLCHSYLSNKLEIVQFRKINYNYFRIIRFPLGSTSNHPLIMAKTFYEIRLFPYAIAQRTF